MVPGRALLGVSTPLTAHLIPARFDANLGESIRVPVSKGRSVNTVTGLAKNMYSVNTVAGLEENRYLLRRLDSGVRLCGGRMQSATLLRGSMRNKNILLRRGGRREYVALDKRVLSHTKCFQRRFAKVDSRTNLSTYS